MAQTSYGTDQIMESMLRWENVLDKNIRETYKPIRIGRGIRQQLFKSEGRFCIAFLLENEINQKRLCYRVWKERIPDAFNRYELISRRINYTNLEYFSNFKYVSQALRIECDNSVMPGVVMDWIEGKTLDSFLNEDWSSMSQEQQLDLIREFYKMFYLLKNNGIAHGDLSCKNIIITPNRKLKLVDYDSMFVEEMGRGYLQVTRGVPSFQHPERITSKQPLKASISDDNFSQFIIALSLWVAYFDDSVIQNYDESNLLINAMDFRGDNPNERLKSLRESKGWNKALSYSNKFSHINDLLDGLWSVAKSLDEVPSICDRITEDIIFSEDFFSKLNNKNSNKTINSEKISFTPIFNANYCGECGNKFASEEELYCPRCGMKRMSL